VENAEIIAGTPLKVGKDVEEKDAQMNLQ